jgi:hypothetical protein
MSLLTGWLWYPSRVVQYQVTTPHTGGRKSIRVQQDKTVTENLEGLFSLSYVISAIRQTSPASLHLRLHMHRPSSCMPFLRVRPLVSSAYMDHYMSSSAGSVNVLPARTRVFTCMVCSPISEALRPRMAPQRLLNRGRRPHPYRPLSPQL